MGLLSMELDMSEHLSSDRERLRQRLADYKLQVVDQEIEGIQAALADIEAASLALQRPWPYQLEPMSAFRLAQEFKP